MYVASGAGTPARLGVGADGWVLTRGIVRKASASDGLPVLYALKQYFIDDFGADPTGVSD
jgi:hypothetical protein